MSTPSKTDSLKNEPGESFDERIDTLFEELSLAIRWQRPSILLATYDSEAGRAKAMLALEKRLPGLGQQAVPFAVDEAHYDVPLLLSRQAQLDRSVFYVTGLSNGGGTDHANAYRALNIRREYFVDHAIHAIFWMTRQEAVELSMYSPDFWAFRHREVVFEQEPANLDERIAQQEAALANLPRQAQLHMRRLEILSDLAGLYRLKGDFELSAARSKQATLLARVMNDADWLGQLWGNLGELYLQLDQPNRAIRAFRKAIRYSPRAGELWRRLGHFYHTMKRFADAIIAYKQAIQLDKHDISATISLLACYTLTGKNELAEKQRQIAGPAMQHATEYNRAMFESVCGNKSKALSLLETALQMKQASLDEIRREPNFDFIRNEVRFEELAASSGPTQ